MGKTETNCEKKIKTKHGIQDERRKNKDETWNPGRNAKNNKGRNMEFRTKRGKMERRNMDRLRTKRGKTQHETCKIEHETCKTSRWKSYPFKHEHARVKMSKVEKNNQDGRRIETPSFGRCNNAPGFKVEMYQLEVMERDHLFHGREICRHHTRKWINPRHQADPAEPGRERHWKRKCTDDFHPMGKTGINIFVK